MAVTPATIATALGVAAPDSGSAQEAQWDLWISDALMLIETRRIELAVAGPLDEAKVDYVVRQAVVAQVQRPDDATQVTESVDDASVSRTYRSSKGRVTIVDEWWTLLGLTAPSGGAFSIDTLGADSMHLPWCSLNFGANYCSCGVDIAGTPVFEGGFW
jgi:hypothetical protein